MVQSQDVFKVVRKVYSNLDTATDQEILTYFSSIKKNSIVGHIKDIEEILFQQKYLDKLSKLGIHNSSLDIEHSLSSFKSQQTPYSYSKEKLDNIEIVHSTNNKIETNNLVIGMIFETLFPSMAIELFTDSFENI